MPSLRTTLVGVVAGVAAVAAIVFAVALILVLWSDPDFSDVVSTPADALAGFDISLKQTHASQPRRFRLRDGNELQAQVLRPSEGDVRMTIVYVHGLLGAGFLLNTSGGMLAQAARAEVIAIDLRGHGFSTGKPGDVDTIGQYERDLGEVVATLRAEQPQRRILLAGHSMGGGIAMRFAMHASPPVDGYLLFAPYLGWNSPTTRKQAASPAAAAAAGQFMRIHLARILGLKLFNLVGITAFNGLATQFFNLPAELPLRAYSYRASESMAPEHIEAAVARIEVPVLVIVGSADEAFVAEEYAGVMSACRSARVVVIDRASHDGVTRDPRAMTAVSEWLAQ